jgi:histidinol-phosphate aminotransferase
VTTTVGALSRASYRDIPLYSTPKERSEVDLSDNTNLWGAPPSALRALRESAEESVTRYPVAFEPALRKALAEYVGVPADMIAPLGSRAISCACPLPRSA